MAHATHAQMRPVQHDDEGIVIGEAVTLELRPASALIRAGGTIIDVLLSVVLLLGVLFIATGAGLTVDGAAFRAIAIGGVVVIIVVVPTAIETASRGRSLGKLALGLRVVRDDGGSIGFRHAFIRALVGVLEIYLTFGGLAVLVGFLNPASKRLGDLMAGTHAQVERVPRAPSNAFGVPEELASWAGIADVGRLPDPLARRVAAYFEHVTQLSPASRARMAASLAAEVSPFVSPVPDAAPERFLAGVVALRRERDARGLELEGARIAALEPMLRETPVGFPQR
ncbi:RDD family protein [Agromyces salentinus]|uniref:RDD family protein n=1 Tax=Agromyces salentinus TaxID=269421 RepID=A0ABP4Z564_9MICO|nr:RDD family protein [Agromyces salentinus]